jgi:CRP-like cAMP-binding protein
MSDASHAAKSLRDRLGGHTEDRLGRALSDLLDNPLLTGAIGRAFDAREKATQAQEVAMGALNLPSATDIERLTRRLRSLSQRLEGIEDGVGRLDRALAPSGVDRSDIDRRLSAIESQLDALLLRLDDAPAGRPAAARRKPTTRTKPPAARAKPAARSKPPAARSRKGA